MKSLTDSRFCQYWLRKDVVNHLWCCPSPIHNHLPTVTEHNLLGNDHHLEPLVIVATMLVTTVAELQPVSAQKVADTLTRDRAPLQARFSHAADTDQQLLHGGAIRLQQLHLTAALQEMVETDLTCRLNFFFNCRQSC